MSALPEWWTRRYSSYSDEERLVLGSNPMKGTQVLEFIEPELEGAST